MLIPVFPKLATHRDKNKNNDSKQVFINIQRSYFSYENILYMLQNIIGNCRVCNYYNEEHQNWYIVGFPLKGVFREPSNSRVIKTIHFYIDNIYS